MKKRPNVRLKPEYSVFLYDFMQEFFYLKYEPKQE